MFNFGAIGEIIKLVRLANNLSEQAPGNTPKFGFLLTNRSFLVPAIGMVINILIMFNAPFLAPVLDLLQSQHPQIVSEYIVIAITSITFMWGFIERMLTSAKVVLTRKQAVDAIAEVVGDDALAQALSKAVATEVKK